jgi:hypothetical protein
MEDGYVEVGCSIVIKDVMLPKHGNVLEVLGMGDDIDVLICLLLLGGAEGDAQGCHADVFGRTDGRTDGRLDDGRGGVRDLDAL